MEEREVNLDNLTGNVIIPARATAAVGLANNERLVLAGLSSTSSVNYFSLVQWSTLERCEYVLLEVKVVPMNKLYQIA